MSWSSDHLRTPRRLRVLWGAALVLAACAAALPATASAAASDFGIASVSASLSTREAGAHPDFTTYVELAQDPASPLDATGFRSPYATTKDLRVILPPGLLANLNAVSRCTAVQFVTGLTSPDGSCPFSSQVGIAVVYAGIGTALTVPIYNLETSGEDTVARFGFYVQNVPAFIEARVRSESQRDYGITAEATGISSVAGLQAVRTTLWGVPADSSHDTERLTLVESANEHKSQSPPRSFGRAPEPFMTNPTACGASLAVGFEADSYAEPGAFRSASAPLGAIVDCPRLGFEPSFSLTPTTREAGAASGADVTLTIPQNEAVNGRATSQLRNAVVQLPAGMTIATGAADGLQACSAEQVRYGVSPPLAAACPDAAKIASAEIDSPALSRPLQGAVYLRTPEPGRLTRVWLVADDLGVHVKLAGELVLDPSTGRITALFQETPQVPLHRIALGFKGGSRGVLATPRSCGTYQTEYRLSPWSGNADAVGAASMSFDRNCAAGGFGPKLSAGTVNPSAGRFSPFVTDLTQASGELNLAGLSISLPPGVLAKLAGVGVCSEAGAASGDCSASSQVGTTTVATGPGPSPLWIPQPGKAPTAVYLAGPYKGGPYSLVAKAPAQAGPFDLGTVVVRAAIEVDPETARGSVTSDPLPQFLEGIPVDYRHLHFEVDRPDFTINPTSCDPMRVSGSARAVTGATAPLSSRFQVANCSRLGFEPKLALQLKGGTKRNAHPALRATLTMPAKGANVARAQVTLPHSQFLDQSHIRTICTRVQFAADNCPRAAVYGRARALTPLLDQPLEGPVYLRSSNNDLPDLVADLRGQVHIVLVGRIDSIDGGVRATFANVPDAPVSKFVLSMQGGRKGLLVNSRNLCTSVHRATVKMDGHNGKVSDFETPLRAGCGKKQSKRK